MTWSHERLKDVAVINRQSLPVSTDPDYEFSYLEISNVDYFGIVSAEDIERLRFEDAPSRARRVVDTGCTVISSVRPNLQAVAYFPDAMADFICSTGFNVVKPDGKRLVPAFVHYCLISDRARQHYESVATGVGYPAVSDKEFGQFSVPLPPADEQQRIVAYLDEICRAIDAAVMAKREQIAILRASFESIVFAAITSGLNRNVPMKPSQIDWLPAIPAHWTTQHIKRRCELLRGKFSHRPRNDPAFYGGPYPFIQTGDISSAGKYITSYSQTLNEDGLAVSKQFPRGTLVMSIAANIGDVAILDFEACFPDSVVGLVPNHQTDLNFLYYMMLAMRPLMLRSAILTTQLNLNYVRIGMNYATFPPRHEQLEIGAFLDAKSAEAAATTGVLKRQMDTLTALRKSLIHECVTGQRRITDEDVNRVIAHAATLA